MIYIETFKALCIIFDTHILTWFI